MSANAIRKITSTFIVKSSRAAWPALLIIVICVVVALGGQSWRQLLEYQRAAILNGEWWRIVTGNVVHLGWSHLSEDLAGLVLLWLLCAPVLAGWRWIVATIAGMLFVGFGLLLFEPSIAWYAGISGVLETYWAAGAILLIARRYREGWWLAVGLVAKIVWEQTTGPIPFSELMTGGAVVVAAHLWGSVGGVIVGFGLWWLDHSMKKKEIE